MARKGFKIADAYVEIHADKDALRQEIKGVPGDVGGDADKAGTDVGRRFGKGVGKGAGPESDRAGRDSGGKLAKGFQMSFLRNSPLIVAAIGGALAAGAPLALAGATVLFAGIGGIAAAQSQRVQQAWVGLWQQIKSESISDASVLVPVYERMAQKIGASFERMRPQIRQTFTDSAPLIDQFTNSLTKAAENALPGFQRAVERGKPVMAGFGAFVEDTGQGLTDFFDNMSEHSPAAGKAFDALGRIIAALLPILGTFMGQGAELASIILPPLASALEVVDDVLKKIGPALPAIVMGFTAMKIVNSLNGPLKTLAQNLAFASYNGNIFAGSAGKMSTAVSTIGTALPVVGAVVAGFAIIQQQATATGQKWADELLKGGQAALTARAQMGDFSSSFKEANSGFGGFVAGLVGVNAQMYLTGESVKQGNEKYKEQLALLTPVERAQLDLTNAVAEHGSKSAEATAAAGRLTQAQKEQKAADEDLELAIHGVTAAMVDEANQAMSSIDSSFAYKNSLNQLEDAQAALADAIKKHGANSEEAQRAELGLEEQNYATAKAFGQQQADLSGLSKDTEEYARMVQTSTLQELYRLRDAAGPQMAAALQQQINVLEASGVKLGETTAEAAALTKKMQGLGVSITQVPGQKYVVISAPTAAQEAAIRALGLHIQRLPNGQIVVSVSGVAAVENAINNAARDRFATVHLRQVGAQMSRGGNVGEAVRGFAGGGTPSRHSDGRLTGPGGPLDDLIGAMTSTGELVRLANSEWVVPGAVGAAQGSAKMRALTAGQADIVPRNAGRAVALGNSGGTSIHIGTVTVPISGVVDLSDTRELKRLGEKIREIIIGLERETK